MKTKTFDSVQMARELRDELSRKIEGMTPEQIVEYLRNTADEVRRELDASRAEQQK